MCTYVYRIQSLFATMVATLVRASLRTISCWRENFDALHQAALEGLPMAAVLSGKYCFEFWDTPPIAQTLSDAASGLPGHPLLGQVLPTAVQVALQEMRRRDDVTLFHRKPFKLQRFLYEEIMKIAYCDSIKLLLRRRWSVLCPLAPFESGMLPDLQDFLGQLSPAWATSILKTWANAWTTSCRMHEPVIRLCIFGCADSRDELHHYLRCPCLWSLLCPGEPNDEMNVCEELLFEGPNFKHAYDLVCAFLTYHSAKRCGQLSPAKLVRLVAAARSHALCSASHAAAVALRGPL